MNKVVKSGENLWSFSVFGHNTISLNKERSQNIAMHVHSRSYTEININKLPDSAYFFFFLSSVFTCMQNGNKQILYSHGDTSRRIVVAQ